MPLACLLAIAHAQSQTVPLTFIRSGVTQTIGGVSNRTLTLSTRKPPGLRSVPAGLTQSLYGTLQLAGSRFYLILGIQAKVQKLFVDSTSSGDMHDDRPAPWHAKSGQASASGIAEIRIPFSGHRAACNVVLIQSGPKTLTVIPDYAFTGRVTLGSRDVPFMLTDGGNLTDGSPVGGILAFDRAGNGQFSAAAERYAPEAPFTINGTSLVLHSVSLRNATATFMPGENVPEIPMPRSFAVGKFAPVFTAGTLAGKPVTFPTDFKDRVVLVYAWASWSAASLDWLPRIRHVYEANKGQSFTVLGICLDQDAAKAAALQMPWPTVSDGKSWRGGVARAFDLTTLPYLLLVDATTGKVVATMNDMIGDKLEAAVKSALH